MMRAARLGPVKRGVWVALAVLMAASTLVSGCMAGRELPRSAAQASADPTAPSQAATGPDATGPGTAGPDATGPGTAGQPAGMGTQFRTVTFTRGERKLETTIVWPTDGPPRLPVILFGHGLGGLPPFYGELLKRWAAAGFVVAAPAFPETKFGVDKVEILDVPNQPADLSAVLDGLIALDASDPIRRRIDPERVAAAGHSAGAISALGLFTANGVEGRDERIDAGVFLAGNSLGVGETFTGDPVPLLFVHTSGDPTVPSATGRGAFRAVPWPKGFLTLPGKEHITPYLAPGDPAFPAVTAATTDFLRWTLLKDGQAGQRLRKTPNLENKF
jgi:dienelactone hydrolase